MKTLTTAIVLSALAVPAAAQPVSVTVETQDINLSSAQGQEVLETRIRNAARKACGFDDRTPGIRGRTVETQRCYDEAMNKAHNKYASAIAQGSYGG